MIDFLDLIKSAAEKLFNSFFANIYYNVFGVASVSMLRLASVPDQRC